MATFRACVAPLLVPIPLLACLAFANSANRDAVAQGGNLSKVICVLRPTEGNEVHGSVVFLQKDGFVEVTGELTGLKPGEHGFHVHEYGDCSDPKVTCAGGHFNPTSKPHGSREAGQRHDGDLGNIKADAEGKAKINFQDRVIQLNGPRSILGRGLIVHADPDDFKTQPTGNAGARVACGVIGIAMP